MKPHLPFWQDVDIKQKRLPEGAIFRMAASPTSWCIFQRRLSSSSRCEHIPPVGWTVYLSAACVNPYRVIKDHTYTISGVENPKLILIIGCIGLALNIISAIFLHGLFWFLWYAIHCWLNFRTWPRNAHTFEHGWAWRGCYERRFRG